MKQYQYQVEIITFVSPQQREKELLHLLNQWGHEGWRVVSLEVDPRLEANEHELKILFERPYFDDKEK